MFNPQPKPEKQEKETKVKWFGGRGYHIINNRSDKRAMEEAKYHRNRKKYLKENPTCKICTLPATTIHHKQGREGSLLWLMSNFLGCCMDCHQKIELNPLWAKKMGYSKQRT